MSKINYTFIRARLHKDITDLKKLASVTHQRALWIGTFDYTHKYATLHTRFARESWSVTRKVLCVVLDAASSIGPMHIYFFL